jgi:c-di-GMP-binding flagellar brake protein YcgR
MREEEKRNFPRLDTRVEVKYRVLLEPEKRSSAESIDLSMGGLRIVLTQSLKIGTLMELEVKVPEYALPIYAMGRVAWIETVPVGEISGGNYETGIEFLRLDDFDRSRLNEYLIKHA